MTRWLVELVGEDFDTSAVPRWFPDGDIHALADRGKSYVTGDALGGGADPAAEAAAVYEAAKAALQELFSVIHLMEPNLMMPSLGNVWFESDDGTRRGFAIASADLVGRSSLTADASIDGAGAASPRPTQAQVFLAASRSNRHLQIAVLLLANSAVSWPHLYRALEEVEAFLGRKANVAGLCSGNQRERFSRSANSAEVAGVDSRHGLGQFEPPPKPMPLNEARDFVTSVVRAALSDASK